MRYNCYEKIREMPGNCKKIVRDTFKEKVVSKIFQNFEKSLGYDNHLGENLAKNNLAIKYFMGKNFLIYQNKTTEIYIWRKE